MGVPEAYSVGSRTVDSSAAGIRSLIGYVMPVVNLENGLGAAARNLG